MAPYRYILPTYRNAIAGRIFEPFRLPYVRTRVPSRAYVRLGEASLRASRRIPGNECQCGWEPVQSGGRIAENERIGGEPRTPGSAAQRGSDHQEEFHP